MHVVKEHFDSIHKLLQTVTARPNNAEMKGCNSSRTGDANFTGTENWEEAVNLFETGYSEPLEEIKRGIARNIKATGINTRRHIRTGVVGYAPHVPNAIQNLPNSMIYTDKQTQKVKAVTIYYAPTANACVGTETFIKSGIAMLSAVNILELSGVRVNLNIVLFNGINDNKNETTFITVKVKDFKEQMDVHKLCFPVIHPSFFRRFGFKWIETSPDINCGGWRFGYGSHNKKMKEHIKFNQNEYFIQLEDTKNAGYNPETLIENLNIK